MINWIQQLVYHFFDINSFWSIVLRSLVWIVLSVIILIATDQPAPEEAKKNVKSYLGFFVFFCLVSTSMIFLLFGFAPG
jgi:hypothetical protein